MSNKESNSDVALQILRDGNYRYVTGKTTHPRQTSTRRNEVAEEQDPFAAVLCCADSRVSPTLIFDQGIGDLFIVRVAGNVASTSVLGSLEYAVEELNVSLILVMGHKNCGAVAAAVKGNGVNGHIRPIVEKIQGAVSLALHQPGDLLDNAVRANVRLVVEQLNTCELSLGQKTAAGKLRIVGGYYDLKSGMVVMI